MEKQRVVITNKAFPETLDLLKTRFDVIANTGVEPWSREELFDHSKDAFGVLAFISDIVDENFLAKCPNLRIIACALKGFDNFDVSACTRRGVWLTIVVDLLTEPTAELCVGLMLGLSRHIQQADQYVRAGLFNGWRTMFYGRSIDQSVVGLLGGGSLGRAIARKLSGFSCRTVVFDRSPNGSLRANNASWAPFNQVVEDSDFLVLALPLTDTTLHLVNAPLLHRVKSTCFLINPARGSLVDEVSVANALESGKLGGYAADVFEFEDWARANRPRRIEPRLLGLRDRTLFTTHLGSAVSDVRKKIELDAAESIIEVANGERPHGAVNDLKSLVT